MSDRIYDERERRRDRKQTERQGGGGGREGGKWVEIRKGRKKEK